MWLGDRYALISYMAATSKEAGVLAAVGTLIHRLPPELAVLLMRDALRANRRFSLNPGYQRFVREHQSLQT